IAGWKGWFQDYRTAGGRAQIDYPAQVPDYRHWTGDIPMPTFHPDGSHDNQLTRLGGGYLAARFSLTDALNAILGARVSHYQVLTRHYDTRDQWTGTDGRYEVENQVTPYAGITWDINPTYAMYASYTDLFQPQSYRDRDNQYLK